MPDLKAGARQRPPTHPGEVIRQTLDDKRISVRGAATRLGIGHQTLSNVVNGDAAVSVDMALRLGKFFGNGPELWLNLQQAVDLYEMGAKLKAELAKIEPLD